MKNKLIILLSALFIIISTSNILAQVTLPYDEPFDTTLNGWVSSLSPIDAPSWVWGTEVIVAEDTFSVISPSGIGSAIMVDADSLTLNYNNLSYPGITIDPATSQNVHLRFNQYLKLSPGDLAYIVVKAGANVDTFQLNLDYALDGETSRYDVQDIDISATTEGNETISSISFASETTSAIWIIDDIKIYDLINETAPVAYIGDSLKAYNIPYDLDSTSWPYVPHQVVVQFYSGTTTAEKNTIRNHMGFTKIGSCCNSEIELWTEKDGGLDIPINELTKGDDGDDEEEAGVQDIELNKYNFNQLQNPPPTPWAALNSRPKGLSSPSNSAILIAILDTGIDYEHDDLKKYIWNNPSTNTCSVDDYIGWNFVHDNNNPDDDHSHGTHVAGIIVDNMLAAGVPECGFRIMPLKTHTFNGTANLFDATCATYYAIKYKANVINDSWGFYGSSSNILKRAMEKARDENILIVTSSGNDSIALDDTPAFPACDAIDNIVTVGSHDLMDATGIYKLSDFSNYSSIQVDILALGDSVLSTVPGINGLRARKTGTSMSCPAMAAILAREYCKKNISYATVMNNVFQKALKVKNLDKKSQQGKILVIKSEKWCQKHVLLLSCIIVCLFLILFWWCWKRNKI